MPKNYEEESLVKYEPRKTGKINVLLRYEGVGTIENLTLTILHSFFYVEIKNTLELLFFGSDMYKMLTF